MIASGLARDDVVERVDLRLRRVRRRSRLQVDAPGQRALVDGDLRRPLHLLEPVVADRHGRQVDRVFLLAARRGRVRGGVRRGGRRGPGTRGRRRAADRRRPQGDDAGCHRQALKLYRIEQSSAVRIFCASRRHPMATDRKWRSHTAAGRSSTWKNGRRVLAEAGHTCSSHHCPTAVACSGTRYTADQVVTNTTGPLGPPKERFVTSSGNGIRRSSSPLGA